MATTQLSPAPAFVQVLTQAGAVAAGSLTLSDANYPVTNMFNPGAGAISVLLYWTATNQVAYDYLDFQLLIRDGKATVPAWKEGPEVYRVSPDKVVEIPVKGMTSGMMVRVLGAMTQTPATVLVVRAAVRLVD